MTAFSILLLSFLSAQSPQGAAQDGDERATIFVEQAGSARKSAHQRVYHPENVAEVAPEEARSFDATAPQLPPAERSAPLSQLSTERGASATADAQLTREKGRRALAQLTSADRSVLAQVVNGTDICDSEPAQPAIVELCLQKLENRSEDFSGRKAKSLSPEERLLGEGLDPDRAASLENAITRLARGQGSLERDEDQAIASVALAQGVLAPSDDAPAEPKEGDLSAETQALINAIVDQLGNPSGGG